MFFQKIYVLFPKQGLARIKSFFKVPTTVYTALNTFLPTFTAFSKRLCFEIGPNPRKDDSCDSTVIYSYFSMPPCRRRRIELEDKEKVVASDWGTESLPP